MWCGLSQLYKNAGPLLNGLICPYLLHLNVAHVLIVLDNKEDNKQIFYTCAGC